MSDRLTAELGALEFLTDDDWIKIGGEILVLGDPITCVPIMNAEELMADTLNWFEDGQLMIGSKCNPEHVEAWRKWNKMMGIEVSEPSMNETTDSGGRGGETLPARS
jgi:hypothetical protein